jgi:hypothetical protein
MAEGKWSEAEASGFVRHVLLNRIFVYLQGGSFVGVRRGSVGFDDGVGQGGGRQMANGKWQRADR